MDDFDDQGNILIISFRHRGHGFLQTHFEDKNEIFSDLFDVEYLWSKFLAVYHFIIIDNWNPIGYQIKTFQGRSEDLIQIIGSECKNGIYFYKMITFRSIFSR